MTIEDEYGLHLRPIAKIKRALENYDGEVILFYKERKANGSDLMGLINLAAPRRAKILVRIIGSHPQDLEKKIIEAVKV